MTGGVTEMEGAGEKFHSGGTSGNAFFDMERMALSMTQLKRVGHQDDMKSWKKKKLRLCAWSKVLWSAVYRGN